jgi:hypothetical protein
LTTELSAIAEAGVTNQRWAADRAAGLVPPGFNPVGNTVTSQAASHRQAMANRADRQRGRVHHPQRGIGERGDAFGAQPRPQHLVQQLMQLLMGECLAPTHDRLRESKETSA